MTAWGGGPWLEPAWSLKRLIKPITLAVALVSLSATGLVSFYASCNAHELTHALVGTALGWDVDQVFLCPGGAAVAYTRTTDAWFASPIEAFSGGLGGAAFLLAAYWLLLVRRSRPLQGPAWWAGGMAVVAGAGAQLAVGVAEGVFSGIEGRDYSQVLDDNLVVSVTALALAMFVSAALYVWRWRAVLGERDAEDGRPSI